MTLDTKDIDIIETLLLCEGFSRGFRHWHDDVAPVKDKKFQALLKAYVSAAEQLEEYLESNGIDIPDE